jgi:hypothetical protein
VTNKPQIHWYEEFAWNIDQADAIVSGRQPSELEIARWVPGLPEREINEEHWPTVDLTKPLIAVPFPGTGELFLIDGWHRVRRASEEGVSVLPVHVMTIDEERSVRAYPEDL